MIRVINHMSCTSSESRWRQPGADAHYAGVLSLLTYKDRNWATTQEPFWMQMRYTGADMAWVLEVTGHQPRHCTYVFLGSHGPLQHVNLICVFFVYYV